MTPDSPSSDDSPLPKKHRPNLGQLSTETTERDLWDFDGDMDEIEPQEAPPAEAGAASQAPRKAEIPKAKTKDGPSSVPEGAEKIRVNVNRPKPKLRKGPPVEAGPAPEREFADLDQWEEAEDAAAEKLRAKPPEKPAEPVDAKPVSLHPHLSLSKFELTGLIGLVVALVAAAGIAYWFSINRIPDGSGSVTESDFPVEGELVTVESAETFWRAPVASGPDSDTVRRGTRLIPVVKLHTQAKNATLRVVFRDDAGTAVGDIATREIDSDTMTFAATAGFDELGMHAAYRTGSVEPWTAEVLEGRPGATRGEDFTRLFEIEISALRR
ncbi:MAG: hypothetical protein KDN05_15405 [Verrucomicrobiae bacterium]|nr:hypothetical protein [Verrucomicrobiae bacterium]